MEYIEKKGNVERVYEVLYDKEKLKELLDKIVRTASYREQGTHIILAGPKYENNKFEEGQEPKLLNGDPRFENITSLSEWSSDGIYSYHGDSIQIKGTKVVPPRLEYIIYNILCIVIYLRYFLEQGRVSIHKCWFLSTLFFT